jgi:hypothetical protein
MMSPLKRIQIQIQVIFNLNLCFQLSCNADLASTMSLPALPTKTHAAILRNWIEHGFALSSFSEEDPPREQDD